MLAFQDVSRTYRGGAGVRDLTFEVESGEIVALVGLNGAGKTTLMRLALGMLRPTRGTVRLFGQPVNAMEPGSWAQVGALVDVPLAYRELTVRQNLDIARLLRGSGEVGRSLREWELAAVADRRFSQLSLGNRQRVGLVSALLHNPRLVVLDEPGSALDPAAVMLLREQLIRHARAGAAILVSSHHLDEVSRVADRVLLMNAGCLIGQLDTSGTDLERVFFERLRQDDADRQAAGQGP